MKQGTSGNAASNAALQSALRLFQKLMLEQQQNGDPDTIKYLQFTEAIQRISATYPGQEHDTLKQKLAIEAIDNIDPTGTNERLQELKIVMQQIIASRITS
jgi:hypothetical protein